MASEITFPIRHVCKQVILAGIQFCSAWTGMTCSSSRDAALLMRLYRRFVLLAAGEGLLQGLRVELM